MVDDLIQSNEDRLFLKVQVQKTEIKNLKIEIGKLRSELDEAKYILSENDKIWNGKINALKEQGKKLPPAERKILSDSINSLIAENNRLKAILNGKEDESDS